MIEINLLPKELKKRQRTAFKMPELNAKFIPIGIGLLAFLIIIQLLMGMMVSVKHNSYKRLDREWAKILPEKREVDALKKEINKIQRKVDIIDQFIIKRILWSRKLNDLSDSMIPGIWLTKLSLDEKGYLNIEGNASSTYGDETAIIGRFITSLKENEDFFKDFSQVELGQIQRKAIKDVEVMRFTISCCFRSADSGAKPADPPAAPAEFKQMGVNNDELPEFEEPKR